LTALVTGASRGIGYSIVRALASRGVRIAMHCHTNRSLTERLCADLPKQGHAVFAADLASNTATSELWNRVVTDFGGIDILVNNAGLFIDHPPLTTSLEDWQGAWRRTLSTNLEAPANLSLLAAQSMKQRASRSPEFGCGRIVNISSRGAFRGEPDAPAYGASKAGLNALSQSLAKALAPHAIYVYCIAPGWVETDMARGHLAGPGGSDILSQHPLGRIASPSEIASATAYCALDAPAAMTGSIIDVNGASYLRT
jgi:NAD(P)-dependent dehydrogenase (short-subunit alcohol dehydrogenase family)